MESPQNPSQESVLPGCGWLQRASGEVEDGAKPDGYDCAHKADDIVGHGEVGRWQGDQERL